MSPFSFSKVHGFPYSRVSFYVYFSSYRFLIKEKAESGRRKKWIRLRALRTGIYVLNTRKLEKWKIIYLTPFFIEENTGTEVVSVNEFLRELSNVFLQMENAIS